MQPRIVDIHEYYRTGGIDLGKLETNFDIVGIRACVGDREDELLVEHVDICRAVGKKYFTYAVQLRRLDPVYQAEFYLSLYKVTEGLACQDVEVAEGQIITADQGRRFVEYVDKHHPAQCWYYSNNYYTKMFGNPPYIRERPVFWAEYPYQVFTYLFRRFDTFLAKYPWWIPRHAASLNITPTIHQFTKKGDAQYYIANPTTNDPKWKTGIKSADLSVGLVYYSDLMKYWDVFDTPPPLPPTDKQKLDRLWKAHPELH